MGGDGQAGGDGRAGAVQCAAVGGATATVPCVVTARRHPHQAVEPPWLPHTQRGCRAEAGVPALGRQTSASTSRSCTPSSPCKVLPLQLRGDSPGRVGALGPCIVLHGTNSSLMSSRAREEVFHAVMGGKAWSEQRAAPPPT